MSEIVEDLNNIKTWLAFKFHLGYAILLKTKFYTSKKVETCGTDGLNIYINKEFWNSLNTLENKYGKEGVFLAKLGLILHNIFHILFYHPLYLTSVEYPELYMLVSDAYANYFLEQVLGNKVRNLLSEVINYFSLKEIATLLTRYSQKYFDEEKLVEMTSYEVYKLLLKYIPKDVVEKLRLRVKQKDLLEPKKSKEEIIEELKERVLLAQYLSQLLAGNMPASLVRLIERLYSSKIDWKTELREAIRLATLGKPYINWFRPSRRYEYLPSTKFYLIPKIYCLVDTSGSISKEVLEQFISELYGIISSTKCKCYILPWDAKAYEFIELSRPSDIEKVKSKIKGGGGTVIKPALEKVLKQLKRDDIVIILSDGIIHDLDYIETKDLFRKLSYLTSLRIFVYTLYEPKFLKNYGYRLIRLTY